MLLQVQMFKQLVILILGLMVLLTMQVTNTPTFTIVGGSVQQVVIHRNFKFNH
jgi:hypothetical protein